MPRVLASWTVHPARRRPRDVVLVVAVVMMTAGVVLGSFESWLFAGLSIVLLGIAAAPFLLPTRYTVTEEGIELRRAFTRRARRFRELRRFEEGAAGALVSPFAHRHWLDRYRGLELSFDGADRERIVAILRERIP